MSVSARQIKANIFRSGEYSRTIRVKAVLAAALDTPLRSETGDGLNMTLGQALQMEYITDADASVIEEGAADRGEFALLQCQQHRDAVLRLLKQCAEMIVDSKRGALTESLRQSLSGALGSFECNLTNHQRTDEHIVGLQREGMGLKAVRHPIHDAEAYHMAKRVGWSVDEVLAVMKEAKIHATSSFASRLPADSAASIAR